MNPASFGAELLGNGVHEGGKIVVGRALDLGHALGRRRVGGGADHRDVSGRDRPELRPAVERSELDFEPAREPALVRPDARHLGPGVAGDHLRQRSGGPGGLPALGDREDARSEHRCVLRVVDADGRDGHARRHLHDREQCVESVEDAQ